MPRKIERRVNKRCTGKVRYADIKSANDGIVKNNGKNCFNNLVMTPYHCEFCGAIHVGHTPTSVFNKIKEQKIVEDNKKKKELKKERHRLDYENFCKKWNLKP